MNMDVILSRLDGARRTGPQTWLARCPAHDDKSPSLSLRETDDGRVLLHCFTGCDVGNILASIGLTFDALFPDGPRTHHAKPERRPFPAADVLRALAFECLVVMTAGASMLAGEFTGGDRERLAVAVGRIQSALDAAGVRHG